MIKKADILLLICLVSLGLFISWYSLAADSQGDKVVVTAGGEVFGVYDLKEEREIEISQGNHTNHITIKDGMVSMTYSSCKNQICVHTGAISHTKDSIACLPNKVIVEIQSDTGGDVDVISG